MFQISMKSAFHSNVFRFLCNWKDSHYELFYLIRRILSCLKRMTTPSSHNHIQLDHTDIMLMWDACKSLLMNNFMRTLLIDFVYSMMCTFFFILEKMVLAVVIGIFRAVFYSISNSGFHIEQQFYSKIQKKHKFHYQFQMWMNDHVITPFPIVDFNYIFFYHFVFFVVYSLIAIFIAMHI